MASPSEVAKRVSLLAKKNLLNEKYYLASFRFLFYLKKAHRRIDFSTNKKRFYSQIQR